MNTTPVNSMGEGAITAIAFNTPSNATLGELMYSDDGDEDPFLLDGITPPPGNIGIFNTVYTPSTTGGGFGGQSNGTIGIEEGETGEFEWTVTSNDAEFLSVFGFLDPDLNTSHGYMMALKFKGVGDDPDNDSDVMVLVPLPRAVWFGAIGLLGVLAIRRRLLI